MRKLGLTTGAALAASALLVMSWPGPELGASSQTQGQAPQATFRSSTNLVEVDVVVHDSDGRFVPGLTAEDLQIYEDGELQDIQQFYLVAHESSGVTARDAGQISDIMIDPRGRRLFVFLFDLGHLSNESLLRIKAGVERFINAQIQPGDFGGIFARGSMHNGRITSDKVELLAGLHAVRPAFDTRDKLLQDLRGFPTIPAEYDAMRIDYGDQHLLDTLAADACEESPEDCTIIGGVDNVEFTLEQKAKAYLREARVLTANTLDQLHLVAGNLSAIPGRKTVIFLSDGFFIEENRSAVQQIAAIAARGGSAFYSVYGQGTAMVGGQLMPDAVTQRRGRNTVFETVNDGPAILTASTGGFMIRNANDINRALGLVARDTSTYYVIGYQPKNGEMDGEVRSIRVEPRVDGLEVRARKSYVASPLPPMRSLQSGGGSGGQ